MKMDKRVLTAAVIVMVIACAAALVIWKKAALKRLPAPEAHPVPVETARVMEGRLEVRDHYLGQIVPLERALISTKLTGYILQLPKHEGDPVKEGELLVEIEARQLEAAIKGIRSQIAAARQDLEAKEAVFDRNRQLIRHEAISKEAFDMSKRALEMARARVKELEQQLISTRVELSYARIASPFAGVVTRRFKDPGDLAAAGAPILEIEEPSSGYRILVKVPQEKSGGYRPGMCAYLTLGGRSTKTEIFRVHPAVDEIGLATVELRIDTPPFGLPSGSSVGVDLVESAPDGLIVPAEALVTAREPMVYAVRGGRLSAVKVEILGRSGGMAAVKGGLSPGELVVTGDPGMLLRLHHGQQVAAVGP